MLLPSIVYAVGSQAMVLAPGGVSDGRGVAEALARDADAVWVGTRMVATVEAAVHAEHKRRIVAARGGDTVFSSIFGPDGHTSTRCGCRRTVSWPSTTTAWPRSRSIMQPPVERLDGFGQIDQPYV